MPEKTKTKKRGRPRKPKPRGTPKKIVCMKTLYTLAQHMAKMTDIAQGLGMDYRTFVRRRHESKKIDETIARAKADGRNKIREAQFDEAVNKRNTRMLIHLGVNYCDQTLKVQHANNPLNPMPAPIQNTKETNITFNFASSEEAMQAYYDSIREN